MCVGGGGGEAAASLPRATSCLVRRLAGTSALHHLLGLLLSHAALSYGLEQPGEGGDTSDTNCQSSST